METENHPNPSRSSNPIAPLIEGAIELLPQRFRSRLVRRAERLLSPNQVIEVLAGATFNPFLRSLLIDAEQQPIPEKHILTQNVYRTLMAQSNIGLAWQPRFYPEIHGIPRLRLREKRKRTDTRETGSRTLSPPEIIPIIDYIAIQAKGVGRRLRAMAEPHPIDGFPDHWELRNPQPTVIFNRNIGHTSLPNTRRESLDGLLLQRLYYGREDRNDIYAHLHHTFEATINEEMPAIDKVALDRLRFLGLANEEEFIEKVNQALINRIEVTCAKHKVDYPIERLQTFMDFAVQSDKLRAEKRRTGESYYCHYLSAAWLLWTMIEDDIENANDLRQAIEDVEVMFIHDIPEDLPHSMIKKDESKFLRMQFPLTIQVPDQSTQRRLTLLLSRDQWHILQSIVKEPGDNGSIWLEKIRTISDEKHNDPQHNAILRRRAARCKAADRFSNFFTMITSRQSYLDVYRKLEETKLSAGQLMWLASFGDLQPKQAFRQLSKLESENRFIALISAVPILAEIEQQIVLGKFAQRFWEVIHTTKEPWARHIVTVIENELIHPDRSEGSYPIWQRRLNELMQCYMIPAEYSRSFIPISGLEKHIGVAHFALNPPSGYEHKPWEFNQFRSLVDVSHKFFQQNTKYIDVVPGGIGTVYGPIYFDGSPLVSISRGIDLEEILSIIFR